MVKTENTKFVRFEKALPDSPDISKVDVLYKEFQTYQDEIGKCARNETAIPSKLILVRAFAQSNHFMASKKKNPQ